MKKINYHGIELLPIKSDIVFKVIFGKPENKDILAKFLSAVLELDIESPEYMELTNTELFPEFEDDKLSRFDLRAKLHDGTQVEIEIQLQNNDDMIARGLYYQAKLFQNQARKGIRYKHLSKAITLNILDYNLLEEKAYLNRFRYMNVNTGKQLSELCEINFLELEKVPSKWYNEKEMWAMFLATENEKVIDMLSKENKDIEKAVEKLKYVSADEIERYRIDQIEKARMDYQSQMQGNYDRGHEEGMEFGARKKAVEIAMGLLDDFDDERISKITGLTKKEIGELR